MSNEIHFDPNQRNQIKILINSINNLNKSTKRSSCIMIFLSIVIVILTLVLVWQG